jgi:hypothetical protein
MVRFDTYNASAHLVRQIENSGVATVVHDGADNLLVELDTGELVSIYLIETRFPTYELRATLAGNDEDDVYSLIILWSDMFLHSEGHPFEPDDWLLSLVELYGDKVYAFDVYGKDIRIFPAYFERVMPAPGAPWTRDYTVRYGPDIDVTRLGCDLTTIGPASAMRGTWRVADFAHAQHNPRPRTEQSRKGQKAPHKPASVVGKSPWEVLQIAPSDDRAAIKRAYRRLARRYHPDINRSAEATVQMQALNQAYDAILRALDQPGA